MWICLEYNSHYRRRRSSGYMHTGGLCNNFFFGCWQLTGPELPGFLLQPFRKPKRIRTAFSPSQLLKLEHAFERNHYVVGAERKQLANSLSLTETQVSILKSLFSLNPRSSSLSSWQHVQLLLVLIDFVTTSTTHPPPNSLSPLIKHVNFSSSRLLCYLLHSGYYPDFFLSCY